MIKYCDNCKRNEETYTKTEKTKVTINGALITLVFKKEKCCNCNSLINRV